MPTEINAAQNSTSIASNDKSSVSSKKTVMREIHNSATKYMQQPTNMVFLRPNRASLMKPPAKAKRVAIATTMAVETVAASIEYPSLDRRNKVSDEPMP
mmetsp:Transcript_23309/g.37330  ORF Transcript_23309/g.37330 Transcript_23309/m.37330 type:complete len:99 (-) Transcript_23309:100-396(-)